MTEWPRTDEIYLCDRTLCADRENGRSITVGDVSAEIDRKKEGVKEKKKKKRKKVGEKKRRGKRKRKEGRKKDNDKDVKHGHAN